MEVIMAEESMKDFAMELEESYKSMNTNQYDGEDLEKWENFQRMLEDKEVVNVKITEIVKGGCIAFVDEVRGFIPASKLSTAFVEDLNVYQGKHLDVIIITVDPEKKKLVLSHRDLEQAKKDAKKAETLANIKEGDILTGKVESLKDYGAFVEVAEGISGLLHISQISHTRVKNPAQALKVGDEITVKVISTKDGKISLSKKVLEAAPGEMKHEKSEEHYNYRQTGAVSTNLGTILKGLKWK